MGLWYSLGRELAGAWRSVSYDVNQQVSSHRAAKLAMADTAELARPYLRRVVAQRQQRHLAATTGVALLVAGGAAGTYLAVAGGLAALTADPLDQPVAAPAPPAVEQTRLGAPRTAAPSAGTREGRPARRPAPVPAPLLAEPALIAGTSAAVPSRQAESTPTPSGSPTPSPNASPTPLPNASPSPSAVRPSPSYSAVYTDKLGRTTGTPSWVGRTGTER